MMKTIRSIVDYWFNSGFDAFSVVNQSSFELREKKLAENFLKKYYLTKKVVNQLSTIQEGIFDLDKQLPDMIFTKDFGFIGLLGGSLFEKNDFEKFKKCLKELQEDYFFVFQDTFGIKSFDRSNALNLRFPADVSWEEIMSGSYISTMLFESSYNNYYVFGEHEAWGLYSANEGYVDDIQLVGEPAPIRILGFNPKFKEIFRDAFKIKKDQYCENVDFIPKNERPNLELMVPSCYR